MDPKIQIERVTLMSDREQSMVAAVTLVVGPTVIRARLVRSRSESEPFLCMPSRQGRDQKWYEVCYLKDRRHFDLAQAAAREAYLQALNRSLPG